MTLTNAAEIMYRGYGFDSVSEESTPSSYPMIGKIGYERWKAIISKDETKAVVKLFKMTGSIQGACEYDCNNQEQIADAIHAIKKRQISETVPTRVEKLEREILFLRIAVYFLFALWCLTIAAAFYILKK